MNDVDGGPEPAPSRLRLDERFQRLASLGSCDLDRTLFDDCISAAGKRTQLRQATSIHEEGFHRLA